MDPLAEQHRSWNMGRIRSTDTLPELAVRSILHRLGFRFRVHCRELPGKPDILLPKYRTAVFIHGCYWHRHPGCKKATTPKTNRTFWLSKFKANITRDKRNQAKLVELGWSVITIWECEILKDPVEASLSICRKLPGCIVEHLDLSRLPTSKEILRYSAKRRDLKLAKTE